MTLIFNDFVRCFIILFSFDYFFFVVWIYQIYVYVI